MVPMSVELFGTPANTRRQRLSKTSAAPLASFSPAPVAVGSVCQSPRLPNGRNITITEEIKERYEKYIDTWYGDDTRAEHAVKIEEELVMQGSCYGLNPNIVDGLRTQIYDLDAKALDALLESTDTLNSAVHSDLACIVSAIAYPGDLGNDAPRMRERIRQWFVALRQIGSPSVQGYAMASSFSTDTKLFVIKSPRNPRGDALVHEAAVGILALNKLRALVPNFMYVYGYTQCSPPVLEAKEPVIWCSSDSPAVSYLISENIRNAVTIGEFVVKPDVFDVDLLAVYLQVFNALNVAYKSYGYTHYDLHMGNIMVRKFPDPIAVPYYGTNPVKVPNGTSATPVGYIVSHYVPYIIDYGYSRVEVNGLSLGTIGLEFGGVDAFGAFPMHDVYKNLCFVAEALLRAYDFDAMDATAASKLAILQQLFSFFNETEALPVRCKRRLDDTKDFYVADSTYRPISYDQFLTWIHTVPGLDTPVITDLAEIRRIGTVVPALDNKIDMCRFYSSVEGKSPPVNALEYCETVNAIRVSNVLTDEQKTSELAKLNSIFDAEQNYLDTVAEFQDVLTQMSDLIRTTTIPSVTGLSVTQLTNPSYMANYRNKMLIVLHAKDLASQAGSSLRSYYCALTEQGKDGAYSAELADFSDVIQINERGIFQDKLTLIDNEDYVRRLNIKEKFWSTEHPNLLLAF